MPFIEEASHQLKIKMTSNSELKKIRPNKDSMIFTAVEMYIDVAKLLQIPQKSLVPNRCAIIIDNSVIKPCANPIIK